MALTLQIMWPSILREATVHVQRAANGYLGPTKKLASRHPLERVVRDSNLYKQAPDDFANPLRTDLHLLYALLVLLG